MNSNNLQLEIFEEIGNALPANQGRSTPYQPVLPAATHHQLRDTGMQNWPVAVDWLSLVAQFVHSAPGQQLVGFLQAELAQKSVIYPAEPFYALQHTPLSSVRVVILGQDPYHGLGQAHGLAFSVPQGVKIPPSLRNIFKEIGRENAHENGQTAAPTAFVPPASGNLDHWAAQGVLLLNTCLTVLDGQPASHAKQGWEVLTDALIQACAQKTEPVVFMLWGAHAQAKQALIAAHNANGRHSVLTANHPSPLSALRPPTPFLGCGHFGRCNQWLLQNGQKKIDW